MAQKPSINGSVIFFSFFSTRCRITIKKRLSDCAVLGCRLVLILDDLLWVLTDDQLKAALHFGDSLSGLLSRATEATQKTKGARKLEVKISNLSIWIDNKPIVWDSS